MALDTTALVAAIAAEAEARVKEDLTALISAIAVYCKQYTSSLPTMDAAVAEDVHDILEIISTALDLNDVLPTVNTVYGDGSFPAAFEADYVSRLEDEFADAETTEDTVEDISEDVGEYPDSPP